jgi:biopolymer transport protein ExbD
MAEINTASADTRKVGVRRSKKLSTKVDLTPMVDLGFLLITFFIFTTNLSESKVVKLDMPKDTPKDSTVATEKNSLTAVLCANDRIFYYEGSLTEALQKGKYGATTYSMSDGFGQVVRNKQFAMEKSGIARNELVLMFKPTGDSNYGNIIDIMDDVIINMVTRPVIMEISKEEKAIVEKKMRSL